MRGVARLGPELIPAIVSMATTAIGATAHSAAVTPPPLGARNIFTLVERSAPGGLDHDAWLVIERHLERAESERTRLVEPRIEELWSRSIAQDWLNWPAIKAAPLRQAREAAIDAQLEVDRRFVASATAELDPLTAAALDRAIVSRGRAIVGAWPLLDAAPGDLEAAFHRVVPRRALDDEAWRAASRVIEEWSAEQWRALVAQRTLRLSACDALDAALVELGIDLADLPAPSDERFIAAFDAWERISEPLAKQTRALLALDRRTLERLRPLLPESLWTALVDDVMSNGLRHSSRSNRAFVDYDFERARRIRALAPETRAAVAARHERWRADDAALFLRWSALYAAMAPAWCPLTYGHWGPQERYRPFDDERGRLAVQRYECSKRASQELRGMLGPHAALLEGDEVEGDDRFEPEPEPAPGSRAVELRSHRFATWHRRPAPGLATRAPYPHQGWFDPGPIGEADVERLAHWIGLDDDARASWLEVHRDLVIRVSATMADVPQSSWFLDGRGYTFVRTSATRRLDAARRHEALLVELETEWWRMAEALVVSDSARRRVRIAAMAREVHRRLDLFDRALGAMSFEHRGETALPWILVGALVVEASEPEPVAVHATPLDADSTPQARMLHDVEPVLQRLRDAARARFDAGAEDARRLIAMQDEGMWLSGAAGDDFTRRRNDAIRALVANDAPHRRGVIALQWELLERLRDFDMEDAERDGESAANPAPRENSRGGVVATWEAQAYPSDLGWDPPIVDRVFAGEPQAELRERLGELGAWHRERDQAIVEEILAVLVATEPTVALDVEASRAVNSKLESLRDRRAELSDRAEVRRRLLWRMHDPERAAPVGDERGWSRYH